MDLLRDLYDLSEENRNFIHASVERDTSSFRPYLDTVERSLYPDAYSNEPIRLAEARRAIASYRRATQDREGTLELMLRFVECGTDFTADFGDIDERFYASLTSMFDTVVRAVAALPVASQRPSVERLVRIVERAGAVGWGYQDDIAGVLQQAFPPPDETGQLSDD